MQRCSPAQSATFYRSFLDDSNDSSSSGGSGNSLAAVSVTQAVQDKLDKVCPRECVVERYSGEGFRHPAYLTTAKRTFLW